jgi:hypothetical protein
MDYAGGLAAGWATRGGHHSSDPWRPSAGYRAAQLLQHQLADLLVTLGCREIYGRRSDTLAVACTIARLADQRDDQGKVNSSSERRSG